MATLVLAVVSVWACHRWTIDHRTVGNGAILIRDAHVAVDGARLWVAWDRITSTDPWYLNLHGGEQGWRFFHQAEPPDDLGWRTLWFGVDTDRVGPEAGQAFVSDRTVVHVPAWVPLLLLAVLPLSRLARMRKGRSGVCPACGYDLRATPERCPECGRAAGGAGA
jgi:hypothetical protein